MRKQLLRFVIDADNEGLILDTIKGLILYHDSRPYQDGDLDIQEANPRFAHGIRDKGIKGKELLLKSLRDSPNKFLNVTDIKRIFSANNFAENSYSSYISQLRSEQAIKRITRNGETYVYLAFPTAS
jgi:hypothetical protein